MDAHLLQNMSPLMIHAAAVCGNTGTLVCGHKVLVEGRKPAGVQTASEPLSAARGTTSWCSLTPMARLYAASWSRVSALSSASTAVQQHS